MRDGVVRWSMRDGVVRWSMRCPSGYMPFSTKDLATDPLPGNVVMGRWERPWFSRPPEGVWRWFMTSAECRRGVTECTPEALIDLLRGMIDVGQLRPDDVVRDIVLLNGRWRVRGWERAQTEA